jgi:excisionase family DNA binding protein
MLRKQKKLGQLKPQNTKVKYLEQKIENLEQETLKQKQAEIITKEILDKFQERLEKVLKESKNQVPVISPNPLKYISRTEVAKLLKISLPTLNEWTKEGLLTSYRISRRIFYKPEEVEKALTERNFTKYQRNIWS